LDATLPARGGFDLQPLAANVNGNISFPIGYKFFRTQPTPSDQERQLDSI
jgi:hypothetical protein